MILLRSKTAATPTLIRVLLAAVLVLVVHSLVLPSKVSALNTVWEDGSNYPQVKKDLLNSYCASSPQKSAQTTWISDANNPGKTFGVDYNPGPGTSVTLMLNVVTFRCTSANTDLVGDFFRPKSGTTSIQGQAPINVPILNPSPENASDIINKPPGALTPAYSRNGWQFTVDTSTIINNVPSVDIFVAATTKQFSWRTTSPTFACIMPPPQKPLPGINNMEDCPGTPTDYIYTLFLHTDTPTVSAGISADCHNVTVSAVDSQKNNTFDFTADFYQNGSLVNPPVGVSNYAGNSWTGSVPAALDVSQPFTYDGWARVRGGRNDGQLGTTGLKSFDGCPIPVTISTTPTVVLHDGENPVSVDFGATVSGNEKVNGLPISHTFYVKRGGAPFKIYQTATNIPENLVFDSGTGSYISTHPLSPPFGFVPQPGDEFCSTVQVQSGYGIITVNNAGTILTNSGNTVPNEICRTFANAPYVSVFGGDVRAGIGFTDAMGNCATTSSDIKGSLSVATGLGAGTQLAAFALGTISEFNTASLTTNHSDLAFANIGAGTPGNFGGFSGCIPHYYGGAQGPGVSNNLNVGTLTDGSHQYTGALTISGGAISAGKHVYLYVKGDVTIDGAITLASTATDRDNIPSFYLVVTDGSIKIKNAVRQLDGVYIAEPSAVVNSGTIYTCVKASGAPYGPGEVDLLYPECFNQLVVNGSFMAKTVKLLRTFGSLRNASATEYSGGAPHSCVANSNSPAATTTVSVCAGEVFNFSPYTYVAQAPSAGPASNTPGAPPSSGYEYIASLPPLL